MRPARSITTLLVSAVITAGLTAHPGVRTSVQWVVANAEAAINPNSGARNGAGAGAVVPTQTDIQVSVAINVPAGMIVSLEGAAGERSGQPGSVPRGSVNVQAAPSPRLGTTPMVDDADVNLKGLRTFLAGLADGPFHLSVGGEAQSNTGR